MTHQRSRRIVNDGYRKLVSRFPHLLLTMVLHLNLPPMSSLTILFHEHTLPALMPLILLAYQTGSYLPTNLYNADHNQTMTTLFPTLLHLISPMQTM